MRLSQIFKWSTPYSRLYFQNTAELNTLSSSEDIALIDKADGFLSTSRISLLQKEIIRKDLIEMAREAEYRQDSLAAELGTNLNTFCNDIIQNSPRPALKEHLLTGLHHLFGFSLFFLGLNLILNGGILHPGYQFSLSDVIQAFILGVCTFCGDRFYRRLEQGQKKQYAVFALFPALLLVFLCDCITEILGLGSVFLPLDGWLLFLLVLAAFGALHLGYQLYWERELKRYPQGLFESDSPGERK